MKMTERKNYILSPLEIIQDLKSKRKIDKFTLQFLEKEIAKTDLTNFWKYKLMDSYLDLNQYQVKND